VFQFSIKAKKKRFSTEEAIDGVFSETLLPLLLMNGMRGKDLSNITAQFIDRSIVKAFSVSSFTI